MAAIPGRYLGAASGGFSWRYLFARLVPYNVAGTEYYSQSCCFVQAAATGVPATDASVCKCSRRANRRRRSSAGRVQSDPEMAQKWPPKKEVAPHKPTRRGAQQEQGQPQWGPRALIGHAPQCLSREEAGWAAWPISGCVKDAKAGHHQTVTMGFPRHGGR